MTERDAPSADAGGPTIAVVGLGEMGRALGRALAAVRTSYRVVGHDAMPERVGEARATGAFDALHWNLIDAVVAADLVFVTEPLDALRRTLAAIGPHLKPGALVTDTLAVKRPALEAARALPAGVSFVGGHPVVEAAEDAGAEPGAVFRGRPYCLVAAPGADAAALRALSQFVTAIGAEPYFIDADEHDALAAGCDVLPALVADALARVVAGSPSADDLRRLASPTLRALVAGDVASAALEPATRAATAAWLDQLLADLAGVRAALAEEAPAGRAALAARAAAARTAWEEDRAAAHLRAARAALETRRGLGEILFGRLGRRRDAGDERP